jgi:hypothetical protein
MVQRLIRILLAMAVALVFTGQVEAASRHCARLAATASAAAHGMPTMEMGSLPCHDAQASQATTELANEPPAHKPTGDASRCECVAVLTACAMPIAANAATRMESYEWAPPVAVTFASLSPAPNLRPPRS